MRRASRRPLAGYQSAAQRKATVAPACLFETIVSFSTQLTALSLLSTQAHTVASMENYTIAVIGSAGVGKSTFIQKVLGLSRPPLASSASVRLVVDNVTQGVSLFELDLENFDQTASSQTMQWPKQINGHIVPRPDAALLLYDVINPESVRPLPQAMSVSRITTSCCALVAPRLTVL